MQVLQNVLGQNLKILKKNKEQQRTKMKPSKDELENPHGLDSNSKAFPVNNGRA